jgi:hypothetical protein
MVWVYLKYKDVLVLDKMLELTAFRYKDLDFPNREKVRNQVVGILSCIYSRQKLDLSSDIF